jgi:hypothetical protein
MRRVAARYVHAHRRGGQKREGPIRCVLGNMADRPMVSHLKKQEVNTPDLPVFRLAREASLTQSD